MMAKVSIRFYKDREVRALKDDENDKWWFSVIDVVGVLNEQEDYQKNRNYRKYLNAKLKKQSADDGSKWEETNDYCYRHSRCHGACQKLSK